MNSQSQCPIILYYTTLLSLSVVCIFLRARSLSLQVCIISNKEKRAQLIMRRGERYIRESGEKPYYAVRLRRARGKKKKKTREGRLRYYAALSLSRNNYYYFMYNLLTLHINTHHSTPLDQLSAHIYYYIFLIDIYINCLLHSVQ